MARRKIELSTSRQGNVIDMKTGKPVSTPVLPIICERIRHYREILGIEQKALAELIGVTKNAVSNWERGRSRPDVNLLPEICEALNITLYDLFNLKDPTIHYTAREQLLVSNYQDLNHSHQYVVDNLIDSLHNVEAFENCPDLKPLTYYDRRLAVNIGGSSELDDEGETVYVHASPVTKRADYIFTVSGNSMEPEFRSGQDVLVQKLQNGPDLQYGEIGVFIVGNETYIKEFQEDGLHSSNPEYPTIHFPEHDSVYLIGRVLGILDKSDYANAQETEHYLATHGE